MPTTAKRDLTLIIAAGFVRALTVGLIGVVLAVGSSLKIAYDVALFVSFRRLRPPEESHHARTESVRANPESISTDDPGAHKTGDKSL